MLFAPPADNGFCTLHRREQLKIVCNVCNLYKNAYL